ncbi:hypothetical protein ACHAWT_003227 [Skeletonema menzelii]|mmetsp:Transcript_16117/g.26376  ORF Transcript_16117/g.26376 Transcript_16117/m.26376 type:complete len:243 (-) Transcript_16117:37-765(-)
MGKKGGGRVRVVQKGPKMPANPMADFAIPPDEELHLPVKPDSSSGYLIWPMGETFTMKYDNFSVIYPNYLDSNKTVKLGRRIAGKDAVPEPTVQDLHEALASLNVRHVIQPYKGYSRDAISRWDNPGRVLVDLEGAAENGIAGMGSDGAFDLDDIPDINDDNNKENENEGKGAGKKQLLREVAKIIPTLPNRQKRIDEKAKAAELEAEKQKKLTIQAEKSNASKGGGGSGSSGKKKKGKKKK